MTERAQAWRNALLGGIFFGLVYGLISSYMSGVLPPASLGQAAVPALRGLTYEDAVDALNEVGLSARRVNVFADRPDRWRHGGTIRDRWLGGVVQVCNDVI
jgi:hypothetical protein